MKTSLRFSSFVFTLLLTTSFASAQVLVEMTGNSIARYQGGFEQWEFPTISQYVQIRGFDGVTCQDLLQGGQILDLVPAGATVAMLFDSTNDIGMGYPVNNHMICIKTTIAELRNRNPDIRIVVANTPPWTHVDTCPPYETRPDSIKDLIEQYNTAYADPVTGLEASFPHVMVADVWTPNVLQSGDDAGWADPNYIRGPCGIHPDQPNQWSATWGHFALAYEQLVLGGYYQQW